MTLAIPIRKNKKGTFLDLSQEDLRSGTFLSNFEEFTEEIQNFMSGTVVSLILPSDLDINDSSDFTILKTIQNKLNNKNISLKDCSNVAFEEASSLQGVEESKEIIDTSYLPETLYIEANLRSGQLVRYPGNIFVLGDINPSAEVYAAGDIIIWGSLRGIAHAGYTGNKNAKIIAMQLKSTQIRIADKIITFSKNMPKDKSKGSTRDPMLVKIENNEIIAKKYFD